MKQKERFDEKPKQEHTEPSLSDRQRSYYGTLQL